MKVKVYKVQIIEEEIEIKDDFPNRRWLEHIEYLVNDVRLKQLEVERYISKISR